MSVWLFAVYGFVLPLLSAVILCRVMRRKLGWLKSKERKAGKERIHRLFPRPRRPLSGGLAILIAFTLGIVAQSMLASEHSPLLSVYLLAVVWAYGLIGLLDDLGKAGGRGLGEREKLLLQSAVGIAFGLVLWYHPGLDVAFGRVNVPFVNHPVDFGPLFPFFVMTVLIATSNAVNLTDGVDGLAGGQVSIAAFFLLAASGILQKPLAAEAALSLLGACLGFLVFNYPPARLLMGDMGSLALGAALGAGAVLAGVEFALPLIGAVFVINALSVIAQVSTVRWLWRVVRFPRQRMTEPFRPFLCAPLHHHFQWLGWPEKQILRLFWGVGALFGAIALAAMGSGLVWLLGLLLVPVPLVLAAIQKLLRGSYFLGMVPLGEGPARLALFQGEPVEVLNRRLYRLVRQTPLSESTLPPGATEGLLWRPMTEIEARVALGALFAQQHLSEEALAEWEEIPMRNLLLRESVVMQLARLYYSRDRLLEAIQLWESLPRTRLISMPSLQEIVRAARFRLAELASKSHRQCMTAFSRAQAGEATNVAELSRQLAVSLGFNHDLLTLLITSRTSTTTGETDAGDAPYRRVESVLRERIHALEQAQSWCTDGLVPDGVAAAATATPLSVGEQLQDSLGFGVQEIEEALGRALSASVEIAACQPNPKASRNAIARLAIHRIGGPAGPDSVIVKSYRAERIAFFSACYRRERALLTMLRGYGCPVPEPLGGLAKSDRALLFIEDAGVDTLAERLERLDVTGRTNLLAAAVTSLATFHRQAHFHLQELREEVRRVDKEVLTPSYHVSACRIALERLFASDDAMAHAGEIDEALRQYQPVARLLASRPETFIHFEFTPHHLLLDEERVTIFDLEQATVGPAEFDLACLLASPESDVPTDAIARLLRSYERVSGFDLDPRAFDYASLAKSLTYAGAALNFHRKFGGEYHLQRLDWYLAHCLRLLNRHSPLGPLRRILAPRLDWVRKNTSAAGAPEPAVSDGGALGAAPPEGTEQ